MDKLKPLIDNHFWIVFVAVLLLPLIGWWPVAGAFRAETEAKISTIDQAFSKVPRGPQANSSWADGLNKIAIKAEEEDHRERISLWDRQWEMMIWPNSISKELQPESYRADIVSRARNIYKGSYKLEIQKVWKAANPFDYETGEGNVLFAESIIPREDFGGLPPTSKQVWDVQEDLWLLESVLKSVKKANQGNELVSDSLVRAIQTIKLVGGPGDYPDAEPSSDGMIPGGDEGFLGGDIPGDEMGMGMGDEGTQTLQAGSVSFSPSDEFGEEQGRYIDFTEGTIYRKRGFYLEAVIDSQRLPDLLAALSNGDWPVSITRVQMAKTGAAGATGMGTTPGASPFESTDPFGGVGSGGDPFGGRFAPSPETSFDIPGLEGMGGNPMSNKHSELAQAAVTGNTLANVAISGVIYIYNPPEIKEGENNDSSNEPSDEQKIEAAAEAPATEKTSSETPEAESKPTPSDEPKSTEAPVPTDSKTTAEKPEVIEEKKEAVPAETP